VLRANSVFSFCPALTLWLDAAWLAVTIGVVRATDLRAVAAPVFLFSVWVGFAWVTASAALLALVSGLTRGARR
jgi:hypothetical protein